MIKFNAILLASHQVLGLLLLPQVKSFWSLYSRGCRRTVCVLPPTFRCEALTPERWYMRRWGFGGVAAVRRGHEDGARDGIGAPKPELSFSPVQGHRYCLLARRRVCIRTWPGWHPTATLVSDVQHLGLRNKCLLFKPPPVAFHHHHPEVTKKGA